MDTGVHADAWGNLMYATTVWRYPWAPKWDSSIDIEIPPGGGSIEAIGNFGVPLIDGAVNNYPQIQLYPIGIGELPVPMDEENVLHYNPDPEEIGWFFMSGWAAWVRWIFYDEADVEVLVTPGNTPLGTFRGPDGLVDPKRANNIIVPAGAGDWAYNMTLPSNVRRMVVGIQSNGDGAGDGSAGYGGKTLIHNLRPAQPASNWPYDDPFLHGGGGDSAIFRVN